MGNTPSLSIHRLVSKVEPGDLLVAEIDIKDPILVMSGAERDG
jgi:hypothetical protein